MNEFEIIKKYLRPLSFKNAGALKLSDDIYFDNKKKIALSIDTFVEKIHFLDSSNPKNFLKKILRSSLSDLYCKGISPKTYFLSLGLNKKFTNHKWLNEFKKILNLEQKKFSISLGGGDTTFSSKLIITIVVVGDVVKKPIFRKGCSLNDDIYVTNTIGDPFIGLNILKKKMNFGRLNNYFIMKYYEPEIPYKVLPILNKFASSSIDISDGLGRDIKHLVINSNFGALIDLNTLPVSAPCKRLLNKKKFKINNIFSNGDDYQTVFTTKSNNRKKILNLSKICKIKVSKIGIVTKEKNITFKYNDRIFNLDSRKLGYIHNFK